MRRVFLVLALLLVFPASAAADIAWQPPQRIEGVKRFRAVDCTSPALCVAVGGDDASVLLSRSTSAKGRVWDAPFQLGPPGSELYAVSCAPEGACVALRAARGAREGPVFAVASSNPGDPASWHATELVRGAPAAVACPAVTLCLATTTGGLFISRNPFDPAPEWTRGNSVEAPMGQLVCPSVRLCLGLSGGVLATTEPGETDSPWTRVHEATGPIACSSETACVTAVADGRLAVSGTPGSAWAELAIPGLPRPELLSCPALDQCVAVVEGGLDAIMTRTPLAGTAWVGAATSRVARSPLAMDCYALDSCVIVGFTGYVTSGVPRAGQARLWTSPRVLDRSMRRLGLTGVSCPSEELCLALTRYPTSLYRSTDPRSGPLTFSALGTRLPESVTRLACPSTNLCRVIDDRRVLSSTDPGGSEAWAAGPRAPSRLHDVACATPRVCVAAGGDDGPLTSTDGGRTWTRRRTSRLARFLTVSCPSARLCVAAGSLGGRVAYLRNPARRSSIWQVARLGSGRAPDGRIMSYHFRSLACPTVRLCVALDWFGRIATTTRPTGGRTAWRVQQLRGFSGFRGQGGIGLSCPTARMCAAVDGSGAAGVTRNPARGAASWTVAPVFAPKFQGVGSVSCPTERFCVAAYNDRLATFPAL